MGGRIHDDAVADTFLAARIDDAGESEIDRLRELLERVEVRAGAALRGDWWSDEQIRVLVRDILSLARQRYSE